jgi:tRNA-2-methylthio-N6-dimethylallyladenosine synthase
MDDPVPIETKTSWLRELTSLQEQMAAQRLAKMVGTCQRALLEGQGDGYLEARLPENSVVRVQGDASLISHYARVRINDARSWIMHGEITEIED